MTDTEPIDVDVIRSRYPSMSSAAPGSVYGDMASLLAAADDARAEVRRLRAENDELHRALLDETYRPEGGEIVMRKLREAQRERDEARGYAEHWRRVAGRHEADHALAHECRRAAEAERDEARTEVQRLRNEIIGWDHGAAILRADLERARECVETLENRAKRRAITARARAEDRAERDALDDLAIIERVALAAPVEQAGAQLAEIGGDECGDLLPGDENLPLAGNLDPEPIDVGEWSPKS